MAERNFSIRLAVIDGGKVKAELLEVGATGEKALRRIETASRPASLALSALDGASGSLRGSLEGLTGRLGPLGGALSRLGPLGLVAGGVIAGIGTVLVRSVEEAAEAETSYRRLEAVLRATGYASGLTGKEIKSFADGMERSTLATAESVEDAASVLATFRSVSGDTFTRALSLAQDMSSVFGQDLSASAVQLGKALEDPINGLTALRRVGISFSASQKELIASLTEAGNAAEAQRVILDALEQQVGGAGSAEAGGVTGAANRLSDAWGNLLKAIGGTPEVTGTAGTALVGLSRIMADIASWIEGEPISQQIVAMNKRLIEAQDTLAKMESEGVSGRGLAIQRSLVQDLERRLDVLIAEARAEADRAESEEAKARAGRREAEAERLSEALKQQREAIAKALDQVSTDPAARIAKVNTEIEELRKKLEALRAQGADPAAIDAAIGQVEELQRRRIEAIEKLAREAAERVASSNAKVIDDLGRRLAGLGDERRAFIDEVLARLSSDATAAQRAEVARLASALYDEKKAHEALETAQRNESQLREEGKRLLEETRTPAEQYAATIDHLSELLRAGAIDQETFNRAAKSAQEGLAQAQHQLLAESREWQDGLQRGLEDYAKSATDAAKATEDAVNDAFKGMEDALVELVRTGKLDFSSLIDSMVADLARLAFRQGITGPLASLLSSLLGGSGGGLDLGSLLASIAHSGGEVGRDALPSRRVDAALFLSAPRFHDGAFLAPDEVPAILQRGERVLSREEARRYNAHAHNRAVTVNVTIQTPSPQAFQASKTQVAASLARAVQAGMRGL